MFFFCGLGCGCFGWLELIVVDSGWGFVDEIYFFVYLWWYVFGFVVG